MTWHGTLFHFVKQPRYYAAIDTIREPASDYWRPSRNRSVPDGQRKRMIADTCNPLGKLPGSVWHLNDTDPTTQPPEGTMPGRTLITRGDAAHLPIPDNSIDLIITSPPFFALRSYTDGGKHYDGQLGSEPTPAEYIAALIECTREWCRVLKDDGSLFVELGDKYNSAQSGQNGANLERTTTMRKLAKQCRRGTTVGNVREKSLMGLPWRYALACIGHTSALDDPAVVKMLLQAVHRGDLTLEDAEEMVDDLASQTSGGLGIILRAEIVWNHVNGLPESVTDRVRRGHSTMFHMVKTPRYYSAIDEIREPHVYPNDIRGESWRRKAYGATDHHSHGDPNPLGKLPGSVWRTNEDDNNGNGPIWDIPSQPLRTPECRLVWDGHTIQWFPTWTEGWQHMRSLARDRWTWEQHSGRPSLRPEVDHFAAFPFEIPRRVILGWSPPGICVACGEGRRPVVAKQLTHTQKIHNLRVGNSSGNKEASFGAPLPGFTTATITGYVCACTPHTDHPGTGGDVNPDRDDGAGRHNFPKFASLDGRKGPWREYHHNQWTPPPTHPARILDPFGGTGTTAVIAAALGRDAISNDMSQDYSRLARWRTTDRPERARAMGVKKPPPQPPAQQSALF